MYYFKSIYVWMFPYIMAFILSCSIFEKTKMRIISALCGGTAVWLLSLLIVKLGWIKG